jgi:hypothetical protein
MQNQADIFWKNELVGQINNLQLDMWHLNGNWTSQKTKTSNEFEKLVSKFNPNKIIKNPIQGTRVLIKYSHNNEEVHALVLSLKSGTLMLKQVIMDEAVKWLIKNVK